VETLSGQGVGGIGWYGYQNLACDLRNNVFTKHPDADAAPAIEVGTGATGTISHNCQSGFSTLVAAYDGGVSPITATDTVDADPLLDSSLNPPAGTPCEGTGVFIRGARHFGGHSMSVTAPDIGARRYFEQREFANRT
jgi:hypothetical protein